MQASDFVRPIERQEDNVGFIYIDFVEDGDTPLARRALVMEGPASLVAYVGVPLTHVLAGQSYDDFPLDVHGGLTYAKPGNGAPHPEEWYWYGWDYAHSSDITKFDRKYNTADPRGHEWTILEVLEHVNDAMRQLRELMEKD